MQKVIIIGGGIAGKLAARVLSEFYNEVIILERDHETKRPIARKGAPQGLHLHALLFAGQYGLEELFPGITEDFYNSGAVRINSTKELAWFHHGVWKLRYDGNFTTTLQTRPQLEWKITQYIKNFSNITIHYNQTVKNFLYNPDENRMTGVEIMDGSGRKTTLEAALVVDASGAGSLSSSWLKKQGLHIPEEKVKIDLTYVSQLVQLNENQSRDWSIKMVYPNPPKEKIGGTLSKVEGNRHIVTISGYHNVINDQEVLKNHNGMLNLARRLPKPDIYDELRDAAPLTKPAIYRIPHIIWRRMDKVKKLPDGLLLLGDTLCRIDPVFGQGMSIAILEALALRKLLRKQKTLGQKWTAVFYKHAAKIIAPIWNMVITEDFRFPDTIGKKPMGLSLQQWYAKQIFLLSSQNQRIYHSFVKVMNLIQPMTILMYPKIIGAVLKRALFK
ncbi:FAD-dependent monooxygenase [Neobacillus mesonae]|uniref:FAD-dependent monooxygenase n=1 Tax=Neobacillus mesonae TaxID=1193713 RepID=UPI00203DBBCA|nr:FAD-dependent monooxygenase [Neobacillus mesonae]MCM3570331.1 FAD-dependent monooxygenase [Neobacillus mesonae]